MLLIMLSEASSLAILLFDLSIVGIGVAGVTPFFPKLVEDCVESLVILCP